MNDEELPIWKAIRRADERFEKAGDTGTKCWIRDYFLPSLEEHGLEVVPKETLLQNEGLKKLAAMVQKVWSCTCNHDRNDRSFTCNCCRIRYELEDLGLTQKRIRVADDGKRPLDECGQVKCETPGCDVWHNPEWSDGTPRYGCSADGSTHEEENKR